MFGAGGGTSSYREAEETDLIVLWGSNARETHPIFFHHLLKGVRNGARLYAVDPRRTSSAEWADVWLGLDVGSDIALANAVGREIIQAGLANREFIERATSDFEAYKAKVESYTLEYAERETGVPGAAIRELAHAFAKADKAMICWTLGITEHHNAVDNVLALINLALLTGHVGKYGSGLNPLRGQNNVQGGGDMGALPDRLPGFQYVENDVLRKRCEMIWGCDIPARRGWHLSGMLEAMDRGELTALYVIGENPLQSEADRHLTERRLGSLDFIVVQDIVLTATAEIADVVLPAAASWAESRGDGHQLRAARPAGPEGARPARRGARGPLDHLRACASPRHGLGRGLGRTHLGRGPRHLTRPPRHDLPAPGGARRDPVAVLGRDPSRRAVPPLPALGGPGARAAGAVRAGRPRPAGRQARRRLPDPADDRAAPRLLQHRRPVGQLHLAAATRRVARHLAGGCRRRWGSRTASGCASSRAAGRSRRPIRLDPSLRPGLTFMTLHFQDDVTTNILTIDATDPKSGTAEFKATAIRIEKLEAHVPA